MHVKSNGSIDVRDDEHLGCSSTSSCISLLFEKLKILIVKIVCSITPIGILCLNQMLHALYLYNTEAVLFACLSSGWATTMGRLLGSKVGNALSVFPKNTVTYYCIGS